MVTGRRLWVSGGVSLAHIFSLSLMPTHFSSEITDLDRGSGQHKYLHHASHLFTDLPRSKRAGSPGALGPRHQTFGKVNLLFDFCNRLNFVSRVNNLYFDLQTFGFCFWRVHAGFPSNISPLVAVTIESMCCDWMLLIYCYIKSFNLYATVFFVQLSRYLSD